MLDYFLFILIICSSFFTSFATNSIYGALQLIVTYCLVGVLLLCYNIDFFAITYIIVCAGGMGVLFLFVIMTLSTVAKDNAQFFIINMFFFSFLFILFFLFVLSVLNFVGNFDLFYLLNSQFLNYTYHEIFGTNTLELGLSLYLEYPLVILFGGTVLFFSLIAAVFLTVAKFTPLFVLNTKKIKLINMV